MKKTLIAFLILLLVMGTFAACSETDEDGNKAINVSLSIQFPKSSESDPIKDQDVKVFEGDSVLDVLLKYIEENPEVRIYLGPGGTYVLGLDDTMEDSEEAKGWLYEVNGEANFIPANECDVKDGDKIVWKFGALSEAYESVDGSSESEDSGDGESEDKEK